MTFQLQNRCGGALTLIFIIAMHSSVSASLITNGSFEVPAVSETGVASISPGSESLGFGWSVNSGNVEVQGQSYAPLPGPAYDGIRFLDLNGITIGTISQSFATLPGYEYQLTFVYGNNYVHTNPSSPATATVRLFDTLSTADLITPLLISHGTSVSGNLDWTIGGTSFTAAGSNTTLRFISTTSTPFGGILLDAVDVTGEISSVPEPSSANLVFIGIGGIVAYTLRRRTRVLQTTFQS